jgi:hypothetical protein
LTRDRAELIYCRPPPRDHLINLYKLSAPEIVVCPCSPAVFPVIRVFFVTGFVAAERMEVSPSEVTATTGLPDTVFRVTPVFLLPSDGIKQAKTFVTLVTYPVRSFWSYTAPNPMVKANGSSSRIGAALIIGAGN